MKDNPSLRPIVKEIGDNLQRISAIRNEAKVVSNSLLSSVISLLRIEHGISEPEKGTQVHDTP